MLTPLVAAPFDEASRTRAHREHRAAIERALARFPVDLEGKGFRFDGRVYRDPEDGILLCDPSRAVRVPISRDRSSRSRVLEPPPRTSLTIAESHNAAPA